MKRIVFFVILSFVNLIVYKANSAIIQVAAPADLNATASGIVGGANDGDIIELTTSGGAYTWTTKITTLTKSIKIRQASGLAQRPIITLPSTSATFFGAFTSSAALYAISFDGIEFVGNSTITNFISVKDNNSAGVGGDVAVTLNNCYFHGFTSTAIMLSYTKGTNWTSSNYFSELKITNSEFDGMATLFVCGVANATPRKLTITNCYFANMGGNVLGTALNFAPDGLVMDHCTFNSCASTSTKYELNIGTKTGYLTPAIITNTLFANRTSTSTTVNVFGTAVSGSPNTNNAVYYTGTGGTNTIYPTSLNYSITSDPVITNKIATAAAYLTSGTDGKTIGYYNAAPIISSFTPTTATNGTSVVITGSNFTSVTAVSFGGTSATTFTVNSDTQITAVVATGTSGSITVVNPAGSATSTGFTYTNSQTISTTVSASSLTLTLLSDITVASGGTLTIDVPVSIHSLTIASGGKVTNSSILTTPTFTINSGVSGTGTYVDLGTSNIATANVNQYFGVARNWYISSPVSNAKAKTGYSFYYRDEANNAWPTMTTGDGTSTGDPLVVGQGYIANLALGTYTFTGTLNTGNPSITVYRTSSQATKPGFNLVGNPFPSYLNGRTVVNASPNLEKSIWYRTQKNNSTTYYFDTYNITGNIGTNNSNNNAFVIGTIPPMQAFWVRVAANQVSATLNFLTSYRTHATDTVNLMKSRAITQSINSVLRLRVSNGTSTDETILYTNPNASIGYDNYDSPKMLNGTSSTIPDVYTLAGTEQLAINGMNNLTDNTEIPLYFKANASNATTYTLTASEISNFESGTQVYIKNNLSGDKQLISDGSLYNFELSTVGSDPTFSVIIKAPGAISEVEKTNNNNIMVYRNENNLITVNYTGDLRTDISLILYNSVGQKSIFKKITNNITTLDNPLSSGVYFVTVNIAGNRITRKIIVN